MGVATETIANERHESPEHWYWKLTLAEHFRLQGYIAEVEKDGADIVIEKNGKRTAVEIETGKSDVEANIKRDVERGFDEVLVIGTRSKPNGLMADESNAKHITLCEALDRE